MTRLLASLSAHRPSRTRVWVAATVTSAVLALAVIGGLLASETGSTPVIFVDRISSALSGLASGAGARTWWTWAFLLGAVAAFNPCGFALLPAYLGLYLYEEKASESVTARARRAVLVSAVVAAAFTALFGAIGAVFAVGSSVVVRWLPWVGLGVGVALTITGGLILSGRSLRSSTPERMANRLGPSATASGTRGFAAFGLAYGLASLGCALPLFLALLGTTVAAGGRASVAIAFALYGVGMATVLGVLTLAVGVAGAQILTRVRGAGRFVSMLGGILLLVSGAYVVYYWLSVGRLLLA